MPAHTRASVPVLHFDLARFACRSESSQCIPALCSSLPSRLHLRLPLPCSGPCAQLDNPTLSYSPRTTSLTVQRRAAMRDSAEERFFRKLEAEVGRPPRSPAPPALLCWCSGRQQASSGQGRTRTASWFAGWRARRVLMVLRPADLRPAVHAL